MTNPKCPNCEIANFKIKDMFLPVICVNEEQECEKKECVRFLFCANCGEIIQVLPQDVSTFSQLLFDIKKQLEYFHVNFNEFVKTGIVNNTN